MLDKQYILIEFNLSSERKKRKTATTTTTHTHTPSIVSEPLNLVGEIRKPIFAVSLILC